MISPMAENRALALIVVRPGPLRDGIEALLASVPQVEIIETVGSARRGRSVAAERRVDLLLLDAGLGGDEVGRLLQGCRGEGSQVHCIVLADDVEQVRWARAAGADAVFLKGFPAERFVMTVERLVPQREGRAPGQPKQQTNAS